MMPLFKGGVRKVCQSIQGSQLSTVLGYFILIIELVKKVYSFKFEAIYILTRYIGAKFKNCYLYSQIFNILFLLIIIFFYSRRRNQCQKRKKQISRRKYFYAREGCEILNELTTFTLLLFSLCLITSWKMAKKLWHWVYSNARKCIILLICKENGM